jgi:selenocysteine lyase/cysteine desulfurase
MQISSHDNHAQLKRSPMANATQGVQKAVNRFVSDAKEGDLEGLKEDVSLAAHEASEALNQQYGKVRKLARENPAATAGVFFGLGALIGAAVYAAAWPQPTASELIKRGLRDSASRARDLFNAGVSSARRAM